MFGRGRLSNIFIQMYFIALFLCVFVVFAAWFSAIWGSVFFFASCFFQCAIYKPLQLTIYASELIVGPFFERLVHVFIEAEHKCFLCCHLLLLI